MSVCWFDRIRNVTVVCEGEEWGDVYSSAPPLPIEEPIPDTQRSPHGDSYPRLPEPIVLCAD